MRAIDLTPAEERRGDRSPMRAGGASYVIVGALVAALLGVTALAFTSKQISDRKAEQQTLEEELAAATARAQALQAFSDFRQVQESRTATIASLAQSRFDWERIMRELSLIIPADVWLVNLTGTVNPSVNLSEGADIASRDSVPGPALELVGCAPNQDSVAGFVAALEDIDGVTRVGIESSQQPSDVSSGITTGSQDETTDDCRTRSFIYLFEIVVAFDAVPTPETATTVPGVPAPAAPPTDDPAQLADANTASTNSSAEQTAEAEQAANLVPGG
jgi:Tfp pilus assembly protein PilN